ncbi:MULTISPECIES: hypothetical protein [Okeania]|uniref:Uncharacterized protein n=1 Tax=Okeania hirsuta TaxID=1458930 RepID=A0A3N6R2Q0_9CYAN|nr:MULTISPECIES: hypothetical protein [Okeania]NES75515.1 hypothetical protein [Okeania sp. SIO1H4]NET17942.1 hypothetical protein [Okeania sp. SIO1H5]NET77386.1 hypothetical protein [Okeania sp. SIO1F9]NET92802.1 hypothetical protein [Okeania sp. SIO1H2]RQH24889.1 hypothetical protein D4Z78_03295 [Okeania hirsuta]
METIEIHEFSTGIIPEILPDGKWISRGFKVGEYMNLTLPQVPHSVGRAIANKGFEVSKDRHSKEPTFVGRVVLSMNDEEPDYSVVAVVTTGQDEYGRSTSFYRYFLCTGKDNIWQILDWISTQQQQGVNPVFNPSETKEVGKPNQHTVTTKSEINLPTEWQNWLSSQVIPVIIPTELSDLQIINKMAEIKANNLPISWAYNVEAIERPEQFIIIHPANTEVEANLLQIQTKMMKNPRKNISTNIDEAAIETAIKGLISGSQIKQEWVENLILKLQNGQVTSKYLNNLFDNLGASNAVKQENANAQMVRLLTLRAIFIPETLPEYLNWLNITGDEKKEDEKQKISLKLQSQLKNYQKSLDPLIVLGMNYAFYQILGGKISVPAFCWLLKTKNSLWSTYSTIIKQQVRHDLEYLESLGNNLLNTNIDQEIEQLIYGNTIWKKLISHLKYRRDRCNYYQPFAELFSQLPDYELAAYFHQLSNGKVPKLIFTSAFPRLKSIYEIRVFGLNVRQELTVSDRIIISIKKYGVQVAVTFLLLLSHALSFVLGYQASKFNNGTIAEPKKNEPSTFSEEQLTDSSTKNVSAISSVKMEKALEKFPTTSSVIREIVQELETEILSQNSTVFIAEDARLKIIQAIKQILEMDIKLQYAGAIEDELLGEPEKYLEAQKQWIEAIYSYQQKFFSSGFGYIEPDKQTAGRLKCDVADLLDIQLQQRPQYCEE